MKHRVKYTPSNKVVAAKAPYQVADLIKEIQDTVYNVSAKYLKNEGWDMNDIADYFVTEVHQVEPGVIKAEIRGELDYEQLSELCSQLDKVVAIKFDKDAYFEPVEPGIAEAFIRTNVEACSGVTTSKSVYIDHYNSFDNGYVLRDFKKMTEEQAQEEAKQASIKDPTDAYYVHYDDVMNPGGDIVWVNGTPYYGTDVHPKGKGIVIDEGAQPVQLRDRIMTYDYSDVEACSNVIASLNYVTPEMKQLKRALSKIYVDNDDQFHELVDSLLSNEPINLVPETRALKRAIDSMVVDSEQEKRSVVYEVAKDLGVIDSSTEIKAYTFDETEDGWGEDVESILSPVFARAEDLMYEVRNTIRGANTDCETVEDLADYIRQLASEFEEAADEIDSL